jgi:hypothetical protein
MTVFDRPGSYPAQMSIERGADGFGPRMSMPAVGKDDDGD